MANISYLSNVPHFSDISTIANNSPTSFYSKSGIKNVYYCSWYDIKRLKGINLFINSSNLFLHRTDDYTRTRTRNCNNLRWNEHLDSHISCDVCGCSCFSRWKVSSFSFLFPCLFWLSKVFLYKVHYLGMYAVSCKVTGFLFCPDHQIPHLTRMTTSIIAKLNQSDILTNKHLLLKTNWKSCRNFI